ncbi:hypothetical protein NUU61_003725 [Penicillium alfredii]|uniref:Transcription factor TFIIIC triple barrel domain-containing protein n=1 Tax=Penicillium alfredii TaxID=1506179 RepID=A0A9W9KD97_9EURO|nr:uncharacterized protein NUU61_003725 [Penicillium alfredii]KAJ5101503.1 hypothetical protein NUU61_003725 [Penicillium alfredii]
MDPLGIDMDSDGDEYEYEYHADETETFYLNLDLSSHHGPVRPPRRRQDPAQQTDEISALAEGNPNANPSTDAFTPLDSAETQALPSERIQILGLHTCNPIVSYYNQIFSCSWANQIGTELVFAHPDSDPDTDHPTPPLQQGPAFELVAANSVKILGRKANITSSSGPGLVQDAGETNASSAPAETMHSPAAGIPRRGAGPTHQAQFIQRLQSIKADKGETDQVRTIVSARRNVNVTERLGGWAKTEAQIAEIQRLNERASRGDMEAWRALDQLTQDTNPHESASLSARESQSPS